MKLFLLLLYCFVHEELASYTHTHTRLTALFPGLPRWAGTRKVKPIWILLKQETVSDSGISWAVCKSAPHSRQITTPAPHHSVVTGRMPFLPPNQQRQSNEGNSCLPVTINENCTRSCNILHSNFSSWFDTLVFILWENLKHFDVKSVSSVYK